MNTETGANFWASITMGNIILFAALVVLALIAAAIILVLLKKPDASASFLLEGGPEGQGGKPSVSRLQMLIWNFVVAFAVLFVLGTKGPKEIQDLLTPTVLTLLGISNGTYLLGKKITPGTGTPSAGTTDTSGSGGQPKPGGEPAAGPGPQGTP